MSITVIPNPDGMTWETWQQTVVGFNPELGNQLFWEGLPWKEFAIRMTLIEPATPRPEFFNGDWRRWACALRQALVV